mmetsp:Transcript_126315/g.232635  ORF Transcript_126315/g.232635 Transcript_126315/m.232635 type:complete len:202 (+) Transcript_126315:308-913(+)
MQHNQGLGCVGFCISPSPCPCTRASACHHIWSLVAKLPHQPHQEPRAPTRRKRAHAEASTESSSLQQLEASLETTLVEQKPWPCMGVQACNHLLPMLRGSLANPYKSSMHGGMKLDHEKIQGGRHCPARSDFARLLHLPVHFEILQPCRLQPSWLRRLGQIRQKQAVKEYPRQLMIRVTPRDGQQNRAEDSPRKRYGLAYC